MKVTQEKLPNSQIGLEIELPGEVSKQAYDAAVQRFSRSINIPGFRKGKVPRHVLVQRIGGQRIKASVLEELIDENFKQALEQEDIPTIGNYKILSNFDELLNRFEPGQPFTFSASADVMPEVKLSEYKGLSLQAEEVKPNLDEVDETLEKYRQQVATLVPIEDRPCQPEDLVVVDMVGYMPSEDDDQEWEEFAGGTASDFQVELTEGRFIPGFIEGIFGMAIGETRDVDTAFPEDYPQEDLAGLPVKFSVTLKEIKQRELPDLDDDLAQEVSEFETLAEWRESIEKRIRETAEEQTKQNRRVALLDALVERVEVELPETLLQQEANQMLTDTAIRLSQQGMDIKKLFTPEIVEKLRETSRPEAAERLKRSLALMEVVEQESITATDEEIAAKIQEVREEMADQELDEEKLTDAVREELISEKTMELLESFSTIEYVPEGTLSKEVEAVEEASDETVDASTATVDAPATDVDEAESSEAVPDSTGEAKDDEADASEASQAEVVETETESKKRTSSKKSSTSKPSSPKKKKAADSE